MRAGSLMGEWDCVRCQCGARAKVADEEGYPACVACALRDMRADNDNAGPDVDAIDAGEITGAE
jgi:hypothetical protein